MYKTPDNYGSDPGLHNLSESSSPKGRPNIPPRILKRPRSDEQDWQNDLKDFKDEMMKGFQSLKSDINAKFEKLEKFIELTRTDIERSMDFLCEKYDTMSLKIANFEVVLKEQRDHITTLESRVEDLSRQSQSAQVEIRNVPTKDKETREDLRNYIRRVSSALKVEGVEVRDAYRLPARKDGRQTIVAELSNSVTKFNLLKAAKSHNVNHPTDRLNCSHLGLTTSSAPIFLGEHLTFKARRLYFLGRELQKAKNYRFCWTANGRVYVRKTEGSPAVLLRDEEQVENMRNTE